MKCVYHRADLDGKCSAALVKLAYPDCELIGLDYGDDLGKFLSGVCSADEIWMVDFCLQPYSLMTSLWANCKRIVWIDHHKTAIDWAESTGFNPLGRRAVGVSACELVWEHLHPKETTPEAVWLLGRYDVWDLEADPRVVPFQYGMRLQDPAPVDQLWRQLTVGDFVSTAIVGNIVKDGQIVQRSIEQGHKAMAEYACFEAEWEGLKWIAVNGPYRGSAVFKSVFDPSKHDGMLSFFWNGKEWRFGMYSDRPDVDVSPIAKAHGGGGHKGAAGFQMTSVEFAAFCGQLIGEDD